MLKQKRTMILCLILVCLLALVAIFTVAGFFTNTYIGSKIVKSETSNMSMRFPQSWIAGLDSGTASISMTSKDAAYAVLTLEESTSDFDADMSIKTYADLLLESMKTVEGASDWEIGDLSDVTVGENTPGVQRTFTVIMNEIELKYLQTVFKSDEVFVEILAWSAPDDFPSAIKVFNTMIRKVTPPTSGTTAVDTTPNETPQQTTPTQDQTTTGAATEPKG